jgi:hypothetical protein
VSFFLRLGSVLKYSPDEHGRWTTGEGSVFVSPNVGHLNIRTAFNTLSSQRHEAMVVAGRDIRYLARRALGAGIGAWKDGAEVTTILIVHGATWNKIRAIAAMKGYIAEQKTCEGCPGPAFTDARLWMRRWCAGVGASSWTLKSVRPLHSSLGFTH